MKNRQIAVSPIHAVESFIGSWKGRASRSEFWWATLFYYVLYYAVAYLGAIYCEKVFSSVVDTSEELEGVTLLVTNALQAGCSIGLGIPMLMLSIRRVHDVGKSGWCCLIPIYNSILFLSGSEQKVNEYGHVPNVQDM